MEDNRSLSEISNVTADKPFYLPLKYFDCESYNGQHLPVQSRLTPRWRVDLLKNFKDVRDDDIVVASYPKAGTHWANDIATKLLLGGDLEAADRAPRPYLELQEREEKRDGFHKKITSFSAYSKLSSPRVCVTHLWYENIPEPFRLKHTKIIYIWRNWKDSIVSHYEMMMRDFENDVPVEWEDTFEKFIQPTAPFGSWCEHIQSYQKQEENPDVLIVSYDQMKKDLMPTVQRLSEFLGTTDLSFETLRKICDSCTIEAAKKATPDTPFVSKGISGRWKKQFTVAQSEKIDLIMSQEGLSDNPFLRLD